MKLPPAEFPEPDWKRLLPERKPGPRPSRPAREDEESVEHYQQRLWAYEKALKEHQSQLRAQRMVRQVRKRSKVEWDRVVPVLQKAVGLGAVDYSTVEDYCLVVGRLRAAETELSREGLVVIGRKGETVKNPLTTVASQYRSMLKTYIGQLGLSPAARVGLSANPDEPEDDDLFD